MYSLLRRLSDHCLEGGGSDPVALKSIITMILPASGNPKNLPVGGGSRTKGPIWPGNRVATSEGDQASNRETRTAQAE